MTDERNRIQQLLNEIQVADSYESAAKARELHELVLSQMRSTSQRSAVEPGSSKPSVTVSEHDSATLTERGVRIRSRFRFEPGQQLTVKLNVTGAKNAGAEVLVDGQVMACTQVAAEPEIYESAITFTNLPEAARQRLAALKTKTKPQAA